MFGGALLALWLALLVPSAVFAQAAPVFSSTPVTAAVEGTAYSYTITVTDADAGDTIAITAVGQLPGWLTLTNNGNRTATLAGVPGAGDVGNYPITLSASDGTNTVQQAFTIIKLAGAAYLAWIGWKMFTSMGHIDLSQRAEKLPLRRYVVQGAVVNFSNPKTILFLGAFLPQFIDMSRAAFPQIMVLGLIVIAVAAATDSFYAVLAGRMGSVLTAARVRAMNRVSGVILMCGAVWLALLRKV